MRTTTLLSHTAAVLCLVGSAQARGAPFTTFLATIPSHRASNQASWSRQPSHFALNPSSKTCLISTRAGTDGTRPVDRVAKALPYILRTRGGAASAAAVPVPAGKPKGSSVSTATFNLVKNILGAGVLSLPAGIAAFSSNPYALVPATVLTLAMGSLSAYCFTLIARSCEMNGVSTYMEAWEKSVSPKTSWMVSGACTFKTFCACLAYSIIIGDSFSSLFGSMGLPAIIAARSNVIGWVTTLILLPLCMLKSFEKLAPFSILGILGTLFTAGVLGLRAVDGTYRPGGVFYEAIAASSRGKLVTNAPLLSPMVFVLVSMLSTAYIAHYNAPKFYSELEGKSMAKLNKVTYTSFAFCAALFVFMMGAGFLTFGANSQGLILNNYAEQDMLAKACRLAIGSSILFGYPLTFVGARDGVLSLLGVRQPSEKTQTTTTLVLLGVLSALALVLRDVGFVVSFGGALLGSCVIYIYPALMFVRTMAKKIASGEIKETGAVRREVKVNYGIIALGVVFAVIGGSVSVLKALK